MLGLVSQFAADGDALTLMLTAVAVMCSSILLPRCTLVADTELKDRLAAADSANVERLGEKTPFVREELGITPTTPSPSPDFVRSMQAKGPFAEENADEEVKQEEEESEGGEAEEADAEEEAAAEGGAAAASAPINVAPGAEVPAKAVPETLPDAAAAKLWKRVCLMNGLEVESCLGEKAQLARFPGSSAQRRIGVSTRTRKVAVQVTLEQEGNALSFPVDSLFQVGLCEAGGAPEAAPQKKEPSSATKPAQRRKQPTTEASPKKPRIQHAPMDKHKLEQLRYAIRSQFDYYFGDANYAKDNFLRSQADDDGWTSLRLVAKFNRVRELTEDFEAVQRSLEGSAIVEVSECGEYVRKRSQDPDEPRG
ncbi:larp7, partial [Symbiodinium microadriaticum]